MFEPARLLITGGYINFITNNVLGLGEQKLRKAVLNDAMSISQLPQACCAGTRTDILRRLLLWIDGNERTAKATWLIGGAASGKSAISRTIIQMCAQTAALKGAIVFLFPSKSYPARNMRGYIIPTIACQIAAYIPQYLEALQGICNSSLRDIISISTQEQIHLLIATPLAAILSESSFAAPALPRLIIIDGLDELDENVLSDSAHPTSDESHEHVMGMLLTLAQQDWFPFRLLVTSRPASWHHIDTKPTTGVFSPPYLNTIFLEGFDARPDIRTYFEAMFKSMIEAEGPQIFSQRGQHDWNHTYDVLVKRTGGHFGHAASIYHFMHTNAITTLPDQRLRALLNDPGSRRLPAGSEGNPFHEIDTEISSILKAAIQHSTRVKVDAVILLFAYCILPHSPKRGRWRLTVHEIEQFHNVRCKSLIQGLLPLVKIVDGRIELLYPCVAEYLLDRSRSGEFHLDSEAQYTLMAQTALGHLSCSRVDHTGHPPIKDNVYALACESLKSLLPHTRLSSLSSTFETISFSHIQRSRTQGLDSLCAFDAILSCANSLPQNTTRIIDAALEVFISREMDAYLTSSMLASVMDFVVCSELIELSGLSDHSPLLRVILPEDSQEHKLDTESLKLRQLLLFGRTSFPRYLAFIRRSLSRCILMHHSGTPGQDRPHLDQSGHSSIYMRHAQVLVNNISRLRSHVQHQIQSDRNIVVYCMRCLPSVLSKAELDERIAVMLKPENRPWDGLPSGSLPPGVVQACNEAAELYLRDYR